jgi:VIT1/CCC1 family predicted Fe2+/Mn2+ transporter
LLLLLPAAYIVFAAVWGMFCNVHFPKFHWENATEAVKQSAAAGLAIAGVLTAVIPGVAVCLLPEAYVTPVSAGVLAVLLLVTALLYGRVSKTDLLDMN